MLGTVFQHPAGLPLTSSFSGAASLFRVLFLPDGLETKGSGVAEARQLIDLSCDSEEDATASEAVLEFLYNHQLPASPTVGHLCKVI